MTCRIGATCHFPTAKVFQPASRSTSETRAARRLMRPRPLGQPESMLDSMRIPTAWWLRPVSRQARDGEQSVVVWKLL